MDKGDDSLSNFRHKDDDYITELYHLYSSVVKKTVISKLYSSSIDDIEDCVQEVFLLAIQKLDELRNHPKLIGWFVITSKNIAMKHNEKLLNKNCINSGSLDNCSGFTVPENQFVEDIMFEQLNKHDVFEKIFEQLEYEEKRLYNLKWINRLSYSEIEETLGLSQSAVKNRISRLKRRIKTAVKKYTS